MINSLENWLRSVYDTNDFLNGGRILPVLVLDCPLK